MSNRARTILPYTAGASVTPNRLVKIGASDKTVILAAAATDKVIGVSVPLITAATGAQADIVVAGECDVVAGGSISRGDPITSDANGAAVTAAPAAGVNNYVIGRAVEAASSGDIFAVLLQPHTMQG